MSVARSVRTNSSIEGTSNIRLRPLPAAAHVKRQAPQLPPPLSELQEHNA
jgi:hypothetical protein